MTSRATLLLLHGKSEFAIMAGAAKAPLTIVCFRHRGCADDHIELKLAMTDSAARFSTVEPMREDHRLHALDSGSPIHKEGAVFIGRGEGRQFISPRAPKEGRGRGEKSDEQE